MKASRGCPKCGRTNLTEGIPSYDGTVYTMCIDCHHMEDENYWDRRAIDLQQYHGLLERISSGGSLKDALRVAGITVPEKEQGYSNEQDTQKP